MSALVTISKLNTYFAGREAELHGAYYALTEAGVRLAVDMAVKGNDFSKDELHAIWAYVAQERRMCQRVR